jgi:hypothetical protein
LFGQAQVALLALPASPLGQATSQIFGPETCALGYAGQHPGTDFVVIVKGEHNISPVWAREHTMGPTDVALDGPANAQQGR